MANLLALKAQHDQSIRDLCNEWEEFPWIIIVKGGAVKETKGDGEMLSCLLTLGGSRTYTVGKKTFVDLSEQAEAKYPHQFFKSNRVGEGDVYEKLVEFLKDEEMYEKINVVTDKAGNETFDAQMNVTMRGRIGAIATPSFYMHDKDGKMLMQTMGPNVGKPAIGKELRLFIQKGKDPLAIYNKAISRIKTWVDDTAGGENDPTPVPDIE